MAKKKAPQRLAGAEESCISPEQEAIIQWFRTVKFRKNLLGGADGGFVQGVKLFQLLPHCRFVHAAQHPHYNYVGDSILGYKSHMGAGSITSNVKSDKTNVVIKNGEEKIETGRKKIGAILSSRVEVGCGTILNPGSVVGHDSNIYPLSMVRGCIAPNSIYKKAGEIAEKR